MYKRFFALFVLIFNLLSFCSISASDTIFIKSPIFHSDLEKQCFEEKDYFGLALSLDSTLNSFKKDSIRQIFDNYVKSIEPAVTKAKGEKKKIYTLFKSSSFRFLNKYAEEVFLNDLYFSGTFNCLTGSLHHAFLLQQLNIPFVIKEATTHVYLLAFPTTVSVPLESTDPSMIYLAPDENFKKKYVDFLLKTKIITNAEFDSDGFEKIFSSHYYTNGNINIRELIGLQYYNSGVMLINKGRLKDAIIQLEKGYILYPSDRIRYLMIAAMQDYCRENDMTQSDDWKYLVNMVDYSRNSESDELYRYRFGKLTATFAINQNNLKKYQEYFEFVSKNLKDTLILKETALIFHSQMARRLAIEGYYNTAWAHVSESYRINPNNMDIIDQVVFIYNKKMFVDYNDKDYLDSITAPLLTTPSLVKHTNFMCTMANRMLALMTKAFANNDKQTGEKIMNWFEDLQSHVNLPVTNLSGIETAYSQASAYYYRLNFKEKSKEVLEKGLSYLPTNERLLQKYKVVFQTKRTTL